MSKPYLTHHAQKRCGHRGISEEAISMVMDYGAQCYKRGAIHYLVGWREVQHWARHGVDLTAYEGIKVVCAFDGKVLTVYRRSQTGNLGRKRSRSRSQQSSNLIADFIQSQYRRCA